jgi:O-antigen ligase
VKRTAIQESPELSASAPRWLRRIAATTVIATPIFVSVSGLETFRVPKELFTIATALVMLPLFPLILTPPVIGRLRAHRLAILLASSAATWVTLCALWSANSGRRDAVVIAWATFIQFIAFLVIAEERTPSPVYWMAIPSAINTVVLVLERWAHWSPVRVVDIEGTHPVTALLGNGNDIGMTLFLGAAAFITIATVETRARWRRMAWASAALFSLGVVLSYTVTAIVALGVTMFLFAIMRLPTWQKRVVVALGLVAIAVILAGVVPGLRVRVVGAYETAREHRYNELLSNRLEPFLAAMEMFRARPVTGLGPKGFATHYFEYKLLVDEKYRTLMPEKMAAWSRGRLINFGEAHDEYLQIAAELGIIGLVLFLAGIVFLGSRGAAPPSTDDECSRFAARLALPLAAGFAVLCVAQFPLRIAAARMFMTLLVALTIAWTSAGERA